MSIKYWRSCFVPPPPPKIGDTPECFEGESTLGAGANIGFKLDPALYAECRRVADEQDISFSRLVREALREKLKRIPPTI